MESFGVGRPEAEQINKKLPIDAILRVQQMRRSLNSIVGPRREENAAAEAEEGEPEETEEGAAAEAEESEPEETVEGEAAEAEEQAAEETVEGEAAEAEERAAEETVEGEAAEAEEQQPRYSRRRLDGNRWAVVYHRTSSGRWL